MHEPTEAKIEYSKKAKPIMPRDKLITSLKQMLQLIEIEWNEDLDKDVPKKWKLFDDLILLPLNCFLLEIWRKLGSFVNSSKKNKNSIFCLIDGNILWKTVATSLKVKRVAKENRINCDGFRTPNVKLLFGDDPWVLTVDNGIKYGN